MSNTRQNRPQYDTPEEEKRKESLILFLTKMREEEGEAALARWCVANVERHHAEAKARGHSKGASQP